MPPAGRSTTRARSACSGAPMPPYHEIHWSDPEEKGRHLLRHPAGHSEAARPLRDAHHRTQSGHDDRARAPIPTWSAALTRVASSRSSIPGRRSTRMSRKSSKRAPRPHSLDPDDAHAPRSFAGGALLKAATGAQVLGPAPRRPATTRTTATRRTGCSRDGERLALDGCHLRAIHTPGHASNHLCYLLEETRMLFTGRPRHAGLHGGDQPARWRHARLPRFAGAAAGPGRRHICAGPWLPDRRAAQGSAGA